MFAIVTVQSPYQSEIIYFFLIFKIFFGRFTQWALLTLGPDTNFPLQSVYQNNPNPQIGLWTNPGSVQFSNNQSKSNGQ